MNSSYFGFFAHAGFLKGLHEIGVRPEHVSGASAGALAAGAYAAGMDPDDMIQGFLDPKIKKIFGEWGAPLRLGGVMTNRPGFTGVFRGKRALEHMRGLMGDRRIEDCRTPTLSIAVANLTRRESEIVNKGPLIEYVMASCAMPVLFKIQEVDGHQLWDGGIADPVPFEHWLDDRRIRRIVVHIVDSTPEPGAKQKLSFIEAMGQSHDIISDELVRLKLDLARRAGKEVVVVETKTPRLGPGKLDGGRQNIELGRRSALEHAERISF